MPTIQWEIVLIGAAVIMAVINFLKDVLQVRWLFNAFAVHTWLARGREGSDIAPEDGIDFDLPRAKRELIKLAAGGRNSRHGRLRATGRFQADAAGAGSGDHAAYQMADAMYER